MLARIRHDVLYSRYHCAVCVDNLATSKGKVEPDCWTRKCIAPQLMQESFRPWLSAFYILRSELIGKTGIGALILRKGKMLDEQSLSLLASMDSTNMKAIMDKHRDGRD